MTPPRLLVLGGPDSGKSTYRGQFCQRIEHTHGELQLRVAVNDRTMIDMDIARLARGLQPLHTNVNTYHSTTISIQNRNGRHLDLEFADYDGEQVRKIAHSNQVPLAWVERAQRAEGWMFFLRIDSVRPDKSFMSDPVGNPGQVPSAATAPFVTMSAELNAVETLQRLLFSCNRSLRHRVGAPRFALLLSCWDELADGERTLRPSDLLQTRAPLLSQFIASTWIPSSRSIWGLSSTEMRLPEKEPNKEFARKGPERHGYIVRDDGSHDNDLTLPVNWLMLPSNAN